MGDFNHMTHVTETDGFWRPLPVGVSGDEYWAQHDLHPEGPRSRHRYYTAPRPCCGRRSTVLVHTDMMGVRQPSVDVRSCAFCGVAWSVTEGLLCTPDLGGNE